MNVRFSGVNMYPGFVGVTVPDQLYDTSWVYWPAELVKTDGIPLLNVIVTPESGVVPSDTRQEIVNPSEEKFAVMLIGTVTLVMVNGFSVPL